MANIFEFLSQGGNFTPEKALKSRQMQFHDRTAYVWGLRYRWDPSLSRNLIPRFPYIKPPCPDQWQVLTTLTLTLTLFFFSHQFWDKSWTIATCRYTRQSPSSNKPLPLSHSPTQRLLDPRFSSWNLSKVNTPSPLLKSETIKRIYKKKEKNGFLWTKVSC